MEDPRKQEFDFGIGSDPEETEEQFVSAFQNNRGNRLKILFRLYKGNYWRLAGSVVTFIIKHAYAWVLPIATGRIIDAITANDPDTLNILIRNAILMVVLISLNVPFNYLHTRLRSHAMRSVEAGLRAALVHKLQQLSIGFHHHTQSGRLQSKIMRDVEAVEGLSSQIFSSLIDIGLNLGVALYVTISRSLLVFGFFLLTVPLAVILIVAFRRPIRGRNNELRVSMEETSAQVMEMVELVPVTRAHNLESWELGRIRRTLTHTAGMGYRLDLLQSYFGALTFVTFQLFQFFCLAFTAYLAYKGKITVGDVVLYQSYFGTILGQVSSLTSLLPSISKGMESITSVGDILLNEDVEEYEAKQLIEDLQGKVDFDDVHFAYDEDGKEVLSGFDLHVKAGETVALVGPSGAGKTTVLNLVIGFYKTNRGRVSIDGIDMNDLDTRSIRKQLAVVPQGTVLFSGTIRDNITYGLEDVSDEQVQAAVDAANLTDLIEELPLGINTYVTEHGSNLSGGQRQRISIARAVIRDPKIIVLDEATSALDSVSEKKIQDAINNLVKGRTTFIVAHRLSTIRDADRIAVVRDGHCTECGTYEELMAKQGEFYHMKKLQS